MPVPLNPLERLVLISLNQAPAPLLDIMGGLHSIALCHKYDPVSVTIFDSPYAREIAEQD